MKYSNYTKNMTYTHVYNMNIIDSINKSNNNSNNNTSNNTNSNNNTIYIKE